MATIIEQLIRAIWGRGGPGGAGSAGAATLISKPTKPIARSGGSAKEIPRS